MGILDGSNYSPRQVLLCLDKLICFSVLIIILNGVSNHFREMQFLWQNKPNCTQIGHFNK